MESIVAVWKLLLGLLVIGLFLGLVAGISALVAYIAMLLWNFIMLLWNFIVV